VSAKRESFFFLAVGLACLAAVFAGFAPSYYLRDSARGALPALFLVHGAILTAWYLIAAAQPFWIAVARFPLHRAFGAAGAVIAIGVAVTGLMAGADALARGVGIDGDAYAFFYLSVADAAVFSALIAAGVLNRCNPAAHKRLMTIASITATFPALGRLAPALGYDPILGAVPYTALIAAVVFYDIIALRRVHPATLIGAGAAIGKLVSYLPAGGSAAWRALVDATGLTVGGA
jgi:hypothetical protein